MPDLTDSLKVKVVELMRFTNFKELLNVFDISILADKSISKKELLNTLNTFYSEENQKKYGVLGIRFKI